MLRLSSYSANTRAGTAAEKQDKIIGFGFIYLNNSLIQKIYRYFGTMPGQIFVCKELTNEGLFVKRKAERDNQVCDEEKLPAF